MLRETINNLLLSLYFVKVQGLKYKIHPALYEHGWPSGLSGRLFTPGLQGSVDRALLRVTFYSFFNFIHDLLLEIFRSNVYIYQYEAFNDTLQYMPKSVKRSHEMHPI